MQTCQELNMSEEQINIDGNFCDVQDGDLNTEIKVIFDKRRAQTLLEAAWKDLPLRLYSDITVIVGEQRFQAHRLVLSSLSDYFPPLLKIDEKGSGEVVLQNISPDDFEILLKYAYTGQLDITLENVQSVLIAADYLSIEFVKKECIKYMESNIDTDNVCDVLIFARSFALTELEKNASQFLLYNLDSLSKTAGFVKLEPHYLAKILDDDHLVLYHNKVVLHSKHREKLVFESVLRYWTARNKDEPKTLEMLIRSVRLPELSEEMLTKSLENFKQLNTNSILKKFFMLRKQALEIISKKDEPDFNSLVTLASDVPSSWFRSRKLAFFTISNGPRRYAAGGEIIRVANPPHIFMSDGNYKIHKIEIWTRSWENAEVIGGLKLVYQHLNEQCNVLEYIKGSNQNPLNHHIVELGSDEYIVKVNIRNGWLIDSLGFETNLGKVYGPFGGTGGGDNEESAPEGQSSYLFDINCESVRTQGSLAIYNLLFRWIAFS